MQKGAYKKFFRGNLQQGWCLVWDELPLLLADNESEADFLTPFQPVLARPRGCGDAVVELSDSLALDAKPARRKSL